MHEVSDVPESTEASVRPRFIGALGSLCAPLILILILGLAPAAAAQSGFSPRPLTEPSYVVKTADHDVRVVVLARGMYRPFAFTLLPNGDALVTERNVQVRLVRNALSTSGRAPSLEGKPLSGIEPQLPHKYAGAGIHDIALHPRFAANGLVYYTYNQPVGEKDNSGNSQIALSLLRGKFNGRGLERVETLFTGSTGAVHGSKMIFAPDGSIFISSASPDKDGPPGMDSDNGKILHLNDDGTVHKDNPFIGKPGVRPEIYSYGHRDAFGMDFVPGTGELLAVEHGPNGGDELNVVLPGRNYGWPTVSFGRRYDGRRISESPVAPGVEQPIMVWLPSIAPSGMAFYTGDRFPKWKNNLFVGSAVRGEVRGTGGLERIVFNTKLEELRRETMLGELHLRVRDVRQGSDGMLYILTDEDDGALLRLEPAP
jgi:glucose/arabinose dehydrogenase